MMTVNSKQEAWNKANEIFPCDYDYDVVRSENAGYPVYFSTSDSIIAWISDLGDRLEVNLPNGKSINIWIDEQTIDADATSDEEIKAGVEAMHSAKSLGRNIHPLFSLEQYTHISLVIYGGLLSDSKQMQDVYDGLKRGESWLVGDVIASYCEAHGIRWGTIRDTKFYHYDHGNSGENGGHFVIEGYIGLRD